MNPKSRNLHLLFTGSLAAVVVLPLLMGAGDDGPSKQVLEARRQQIERMSEADRERLKRKFETFLKFSEAERWKYRQLHEQLESDAKTGGTLRETMHAYHNWLNKLPPWQRLELRKEKDSGKRLGLVKQFMQEQKDRGKEPRRVFGSRFGQGGRSWGGFRYRLNSEDLKTVMGLIEQNANLPRDSATAVKESDEGLPRYLLLLESVLKRDPVIERPNRKLWPDEPLLEKLVASISNAKIQEHFKDRIEPDRRRRFLIGLIGGALFGELREEAIRRQPSDNLLEEFFVQLKDRDRDEIMALPPEHTKRHLAEKYFSEHDQKFLELRSKTYRINRELWGRAGIGPPGGTRWRGRGGSHPGTRRSNRTRPGNGGGPRPRPGDRERPIPPT